ncbi:hypothetical protein GCM10023232_26710 [Sphingosinicella ginsenosidimutans]|nr:hypothetical protein [Sphingosinicella ginsenosidimutans]
MTEPDPTFTTRAELLAWTRQRLRYPDPAELHALPAPEVGQ